MARLTEDERHLLTEVIRSRTHLSPLLDQLDRGENLSTPDANLLREAIGDELAATGVTDGAINERGVHLDRLIDRIARRSDLDHS